MKTVVVTGSTRGLGFGLVTAFHALGCNVVVNGRSKVDEAAAKLGGADRVLAHAGDVCDEAPVRALWSAASKRFGRVDLWVNNAGSGSQQIPFAAQSPEVVANVVRTNLVGAVLGTRVALEGMKAQTGGGQIFNVEGFGSNPVAKRTGMAVYGATKCATRYFTQSVAKELAGGDVLLGAIAPGVVVTDMLINQFDGVPRAQWEKSRRIYNRLADDVSTVAPWLAARMLANTQNGVLIAWLNPLQMLGRILSPLRGGRDVLSKYLAPKVT